MIKRRLSRIVIFKCSDLSNARKLVQELEKFTFFSTPIQATLIADNARAGKVGLERRITFECGTK